MKIAIIILALALVLFILLFILAERAFRDTVNEAAKRMVEDAFKRQELALELEQLKRRINRLEVIADEVEKEG